MKDQEHLKTLFNKYLSAQCTPDEIKELFKLIGKRENEETFSALVAEQLQKDVNERVHAERQNNAISKVKAILLSEISAQIPEKKSYFKIPITWLKIAALWLIIGSATMFLLYRHFSDTYNTQIQQHTHQLITQNGQRKLLQLFDGTKIWLSPSSTIKYSDQLVNSYREVWLDGEAFFEVAKDKTHPFIIHSGRMQTEVVGTSFNIKSFSKQSIYKVTVVTGVVRVAMLSDKHEKLSEVVLKPKQEAVLNNTKATLASNNVATVDPVVKKKNGILSYDGTPVPEVVADFSRYYNQKIVLENKSASCLCYGDFDTSKPIDIVLSQLAAAISAKVRQTTDGYTLEGGCAER